MEQQPRAPRDVSGAEPVPDCTDTSIEIGQRELDVRVLAPRSATDLTPEAIWLEHGIDRVLHLGLAGEQLLIKPLRSIELEVAERLTAP